MTRNGFDLFMEHRTKWPRLVLLVIALVGISLGLSVVVQKLVGAHLATLHQYDWLAYAGIFLVMLVGNVTIVAPVPVTTGIMISLATQFNPFMVALFATLGGCLGEMSGYYAGYLGKKLAIDIHSNVYVVIERWMDKYGIWAISFLAFQPVLPFDIGGLIAGAARMPVWKFLPALFLGKFPKYLILTFSGFGLLNFLR